MPLDRRLSLLAVLLCALPGSRASAAEFVRFQPHEINPMAGTGLAITATDVNGDGRPDIVGVSDRDVSWYENPSWSRRPIANQLKGSNVCIAARDLDGDGLPEFALGADWQFTNTKSGGALYILRRKASLEEAWEFKEIATEPTLHRIRWADVDGDSRPELIVAPLKGRNSTGPLFAESGARLMAFRPPVDFMTEPWPMEVIDDSLHLLHNIQTVRGWRGEYIYAASLEGVTAFHFGLDSDVESAGDDRWEKGLLIKGNPAPAPQSGAGEIKIGSLKNGAAHLRALGTIEPWHGNQAVVYVWTPNPDAAKNIPTTPEMVGEWTRYVIDDTLAQGHAIWFADFDGDGQDEFLVGFREKAPPRNLPGLNIYDLRIDGSGKLAWEKQIIDDGGMATEDAVVADFNSDGRPDIAAFGRATHNIRLYSNLGTIPR